MVLASDATSLNHKVLLSSTKGPGMNNLQGSKETVFDASSQYATGSSAHDMVTVVQVRASEVSGEAAIWRRSFP